MIANLLPAHYRSGQSVTRHHVARQLYPGRLDQRKYLRTLAQSKPFTAVTRDHRRKRMATIEGQLHPRVQSVRTQGGNPGKQLIARAGTQA
ncbi:MAG: hypothetical protein CMK85_07925 [Pseudomonadales bacterium]|nr:hypothetical protein [Pseudomonadales bacterium]MAS66892.1 hypothetical protein [Pseudomonadales bacterium]MBP76323.1 hypothetical protein [Pseudomonadales bacterium]